MCQRPSQTMLEAATEAGFVGLLHKLLNCSRAKPLYLGDAVQRHTSASDEAEVIGRLLRGAQRCVS